MKGDDILNKKPTYEVMEGTVAVDTLKLMQITDSGRATATAIGRAAEAQIRIGRKVLWNVAKVQRYLDAVSE